MSEPGLGPRGPFPELSTLPPPDPPPADPDPQDPDTDDIFEEEAGDNALLVKLGDCRRCQHNLTQNAELILLNAMKFSYGALADSINYSRAKTAQISRNIPINAAQLLELLSFFGVGANAVPGPQAPLAGLVFFPTQDFFDQPEGAPLAEYDVGRASPTEIGTFYMTAVAHAYQLWLRTKKNQKECCKKHVLPQNPFRKRTTIWIGNTKKKVTV